ncbi:TetR/AcrR family transcriptional regulator [Flavobacterium sp. xlx-214]|uniref:TetR/AcrR family transcriptional regulator n=1 Tax=unclassified Flavobacterium TaxID=196869 RepID=UPI0013D206C3|nr:MULTISPECIES: TetR/AcrR family transcriptional regulator [unclassified Flavobacterium]MBA5791691.1 TetR/AcrR family transcriptional regulator [Flavobacterium sp. xlx-221]QMI82934.1 TetR/AcrR family transcriptional regulator [Flavobacterium sp. xlx-214]
MKASNNIRENILDTATNLFYKQGYHATGINQIIDEAAIARGSLYNHFKSKNDLFYAYLEKTNEHWFEQLYSYIKKIKHPKDKILGLFDFRIKRQTQNSFRGCPFIKAGAEVPQDDKKAFKIINQNKMKFRNYILELLNDVMLKNNLFTKEELADTIYMLVEGATVTASFQKNKEMMGKAKEITDKLI